MDQAARARRLADESGSPHWSETFTKFTLPGETAAEASK